MPIAFVLDENLRGKPLWPAICRRNIGAGATIDATRVGDRNDLPLGSLDAAILVWAECNSRIVLTEDAATFPAELRAHLLSGRATPGLFVIRPSATVVAVLAWLELVALDDQPDQWRDQVHYIP
jgi:hypothetical protein